MPTPKDVPRKPVRAVDAKHEGDRRRNLELLESFFHKQTIPKVVPGLPLLFPVK
jgi:hypothetical protein